MSCQLLHPRATGGRRGIRTPDAFRHSCFQDRCNKPLYHPSVEPNFGIEPKTYALQVRCSTTELIRHSHTISNFIVRCECNRDRSWSPYRFISFLKYDISRDFIIRHSLGKNLHTFLHLCSR